MTGPASDKAAGGRDLAGKVALVTGSARNIGRAIALALAEGGARLVVSGRSDDGQGRAVAEAIRAAGGEADWMAADIADPAQAAALVAFAEARFGRLDVLVNNASLRKATPLLDITPEEWRSLLAVAVDGAFFVSQAASRIIGPGGSIVTIGGMGGHTGTLGRVHGSTAKAALVGLTKALAQELAPAGITANLVAPGVIDTRRGASSGSLPGGLPAPLIDRLGQPEEIAAAVRFLAGPGARFITGQTLHVNGGAYLP